MRDLLLYKLTAEALTRLEESRLSKRELIRQVAACSPGFGLLISIASRVLPVLTSAYTRFRLMTASSGSDLWARRK